MNVKWSHVAVGIIPLALLLTYVLYLILSNSTITWTSFTIGETTKTQIHINALNSNFTMSTDTPTITPPFNTSFGMTANTSESTTGFYETEEEIQRDFWVGLILAVSSSVFIGTSFILTKLGLLSVAKKSGARAAEGGHEYLKEWLWWLGMSLMVGGEVCNFAAYAFAPATLVTPLGALSVIASAVLASYFLKERLNLLGKIGCALCILGSTVMVIHAPRESEIHNMEELRQKMADPGIITLCCIMVVIAAVFIIFLAPRYGQKNVVIYVVICSTLGSLTVMGCKGVGVALKATFHGSNQFTHFMTYIMLGFVAGCILFQVNYLNKALDTFNTAIVTPTYYVLFTSCVILVSLVLFKEFYNMSATDIIGDLCGFLTIVLGIFMLNWFKEMDITFKNIPKAQKKTAQDVYYNNKDGKHFVALDHDNDSLLECNENSSLDDVHLLEYYDNPSYMDSPAPSYTELPNGIEKSEEKKSIPNGVVPKEDESTHL